MTQVVYHGLDDTGCISWTGWHRLYIMDWMTQVGCLAATSPQQSDQSQNLRKPRAKIKLTSHVHSEQWHLHVLHGLVVPWEASCSLSFTETGG